MDDFLFTYYSYRPAALRRWHPGMGVTLLGAGVDAYAGSRGYVVEADRAWLDPVWCTTLAGRASRIRSVLVSTASRPAQLGCFGLHEWAMVYRQSPDQVRHPSYPLRLGARGTDEVVETHRIACTHFDAFRFFTEPARSLNVVQPTRQDRPQMEQPGCLHAAMDCYKWAYQLAPLTPSELVADCFELARDVRQVDMAAAPYDLSPLGVEPIPIETAAGKSAYRSAQRGFADHAAVLRQRLVEVCDAVPTASADPH